MARGCSSCSRRRKKKRNNTRSNSIKQGVTMQAADFVSKFYIGETGNIDSLVSGIQYGFKKYGSKVMVHVKDFKAYPELWAMELPQDESTELIEEPIEESILIIEG